MVTIILHCPHCGSEALVRDGHAPNGKQKYRCHACRRRSCENPTPNAYPEAVCLLLGTLADLARGKSERVLKMRSYANTSSSFAGRANDQRAPRGIASCWCFWQRPFEPGGKPS